MVPILHRCDHHLPGTWQRQPRKTCFLKHLEWGEWERGLGRTLWGPMKASEGNSGWWRPAHKHMSPWIWFPAPYKLSAKGEKAFHTAEVNSSCSGSSSGQWSLQLHNWELTPLCKSLLCSKRDKERGFPYALPDWMWVPRVILCLWRCGQWLYSWPMSDVCWYVCGSLTAHPSWLLSISRGLTGLKLL